MFRNNTEQKEAANSSETCNLEKQFKGTKIINFKVCDGSYLPTYIFHSPLSQILRSMSTGFEMSPATHVKLNTSSPEGRGL